jgi:hypothetical protein
MKHWMTFGLTVGLSALLSVAFAQHDHDHEGDIHLGAIDGAAAVVEPHELAEPPYRIRYTLEELLPGLFGVDVGWDFHTEEGDDHPQLRQVTIQQLFISPRLVGVIEGETDPIFGEGLPGTWTLILRPERPRSRASAHHLRDRLPAERGQPADLPVPLGERHRVGRRAAERLWWTTRWSSCRSLRACWRWARVWQV